MTDLKACPFCGERPKWANAAMEAGYGMFYCSGGGHDVDTGPVTTKAAAAKHWNRRASPWRTDMENAPKDGTPVLLHAPVSHEYPARTGEGLWYEEFGRSGWAWANDSCSCCYGHMLQTPTAWMPIPPFDGGGA